MIGEIPRVESYEEPVNKFLRAHGAALAMIRVRVHRELEKILDRYPMKAAEDVRGLTRRLNKTEVERALFPRRPARSHQG